MALDIVIRNEEDAWKWFEKALNNDPELEQPLNIRFDGWPTLDLRYKGNDFDSSVPTRIMPTLLEAQKEINRFYAQLRYGDQNLLRLKQEERERLELNVKVKKGSSEYATNLSNVLTESARSAVSNMESTHILYSVLFIALTWGATIAWKSWLKHQAEIKGMDHDVKLTKLENDRIGLLARAHKKEPYLEDLSEGVDEFRNDSLTKLKPMDSLTLPNSDVKIDGRYASELTHRKREQSEEHRIDGEFIILSVTSGGEAQGFKIKVRRRIDDEEFTVTIPEGTLTSDQIDILKNNEWAKKPVLLEINAKVLRGSITAATLIKASNIQRHAH